MVDFFADFVDFDSHICEALSQEGIIEENTVVELCLKDDLLKKRVSSTFFVCVYNNFFPRKLEYLINSYI